MVGDKSTGDRSNECDPFRVDYGLLPVPWALPTAIELVPFGDKNAQSS